VFLERLAFEMDKRYEETKLQVLLSPTLLIAKDQYQVLCANMSSDVWSFLLTGFVWLAIFFRISLGKAR